MACVTAILMRDEDGGDAYRKAIDALGGAAVFVPVLTSAFVNEAALDKVCIL